MYIWPRRDTRLSGFTERDVQTSKDTTLNYNKLKLLL